MKLYRTSSLVLLFFIGFSFSNCCNCPELTGVFFDIMGVNTSMHDVDRGEIFEGSTIDFDNFSHITANFEVNYISDNSVSSDFDFDFSIMPTAYGFSCDCLFNGESGSKFEIIRDISIITLKDYNDDFAANDTINSLFGINKFNPHFDEYEDLNEFLANNSQNVEREVIHFRPTEAPTASNDFQVKFIIDLSTGEQYEFTTPSIIFE